MFEAYDSEFGMDDDSADEAQSHELGLEWTEDWDEFMSDESVAQLAHDRGVVAVLRSL